MQTFEDIETYLDFLYRIGGQRDTQGVAYPLGQQHAQTDGGLDRAGTKASGLGDPQVQGLFDLPGQLAVGGHGHEDIGGLETDLVFLKIELVENIDMTQGRFHQGIRGRFAVFFLQVLFQRTGIDADTDRHAAIPCRIDQGTHPIGLADIAGIDTQTVHAQLQHAQGNAVVKMDIGNQRHIDLLADPAKGLGRLHAGHRDTHDVCTGLFQRADLRDRGGHIGGFGIGHALHRNWRVAPYRDIAHHNLTRLASHDRTVMLHRDYLETG